MLPPILWPPSDEDRISELVGRGDCQALRAYFDAAFWAGKKPAPTWDHLKAALRAENKPVLKLLITWGARVAAPQLAELKAAAQDKFAAYVGMLRQCGLSSSLTPSFLAAAEAAAKDFAPHPVAPPKGMPEAAAAAQPPRRKGWFFSDGGDGGPR